MKRKLSFILILALLTLAFTACKSDSEASSPSSTPSASQLDLGDISAPPIISSLPDSVPDTVSSGLPEESDKDTLSPVSGEETNIHVDLTEIQNLDNTKQGWGQGVQKNDLNQPVGSISYQEKYGSYDAYFIAGDDPVIYLTFDEGYENGYTASILDTLKEKNVPAVFFCTMPYIKSQPELVQRMIDEGHTVGSHSTKHLSFPTMELSDALDDLQGLHNYMLENYDYKMTLFRFPMGEFSERTLALAQQLGYKSVFWSYAYQDWDVNNQFDTATAFDKVTQNAHNGAIYLLHAVSKTNAEILGDVIDSFREKGFELKLFE